MRPTRPRQPCRRVASTICRVAAPAANPPEPERQHRREAAGTEHDRQHERAGRAPGRPVQPLRQQFGRRLPPWQHRRNGHEEQQHEADGHRHAVEVRAADEDAAILQRLDDQREHRAEQDDERERREEDVVGQECAFT